MQDSTSTIYFEDPFVTEADVAGLYHPDTAAVASRQTACDQGSGPTRIDD